MWKFKVKKIYQLRVNGENNYETLDPCPLVKNGLRPLVEIEKCRKCCRKGVCSSDSINGINMQLKVVFMVGIHKLS